MKSTRIILAATLFVCMYSCRQSPDAGKSSIYSGTGDTTNFIPMDSANKMLGSYLNSINYSSNDTDLQSLVIDVHQLRAYIDSMPGSDSISQLKLMFAHTLAYTNSSGVNTNAGYKSNALTIIIAAISAQGNYILFQNNKVMDYASPCPPICPPGNAQSPFIIKTRSKR